MQLFKTILYLLCTSILFVSCGEKADPEMTLVRFTKSEGGRPVSLNKGVMIIAQNNNFGKSLGIYGTSLPALQSETFLPNGSYLFYAFGYDGGSNVFNNDLYCGIANGGSSIRLTGGTVDINLTLVNNSSTACPGIFAPAGFTNGTNLYNVNIFFCGTPFNTSSAATACTTSPNSYVELAILEERSLISASPRPVFRDCINLISGFSITGNKIPYGPQYKLSIRKFSDSGCSTTPLGPAYIINDGINNVPTLTGSNTNFGRVGPNPTILYVGLSLL